MPPFIIQLLHIKHAHHTTFYTPRTMAKQNDKTRSHNPQQKIPTTRFSKQKLPPHDITRTSTRRHSKLYPDSNLSARASGLIDPLFTPSPPPFAPVAHNTTPTHNPRVHLPRYIDRFRAYTHMGQLICNARAGCRECVCVVWTVRMQSYLDRTRSIRVNNGNFNVPRRAR